jgi:hypothetical protein
MPDRPQSTLPHDFEETAGFRETTLYIFPPEHSDTARRFGRMLYEILLEGMPYYGEENESTTLREMNAALADAVHLRDFFWSVGQEIEDNEMNSMDARLSLLAQDLTSGMDRIIDSLQEALK